MAKTRDIREPVMVIGLGKFGIAVATTLEQIGHEVLAVDSRPDVVQTYAPLLTQVVEADASREEVLLQLDVKEFDSVVVGIGDVERSVLCVVTLVDLGIRNVWAKAVSSEHERILKRIGAHQVVQPESRVGKRVAHLVQGGMLDFMEFDDSFAMIKARVPGFMANKALTETQVRSRYGVTVVGTKRPGRDFVHAVPSTVIRPDDQIIVCGPTDYCERFSSLSKAEAMAALDQEIGENRSIR